MNTTEFLVIAIVFSAACWALFRGRPPAYRGVIVLLLLSMAATAPWAWARLTQSSNDAATLVPPKTEKRGFVSSKSCRSCHPHEYASWHATYHRTMTQVASAQSVVPSFDDVTLNSRSGGTHFLHRRAEEFWVTYDDPPPGEIREPLSYRIVMTTGSHEVQTYWIKSRSGSELWQFPWYYHIEEKQWIQIDEAFLQPTLTKSAAQAHREGTRAWNKHCIQCHSTGGNPGYNQRLKHFFSDVAELGISCEACHGPAEKHVTLFRNPVDRYQQRLQSGEPLHIVNPAKLSPEQSSQICGQCHSSFERLDAAQYFSVGQNYRAGEDFELTRQLKRFDLEENRSPTSQQPPEINFWGDGTNCVGGDELNGLIESPCYQQGDGDRKLSCLSCHSMHNSDPNDQLATHMDGNHACTQCHTEAHFGDRLEEHTHHRAGSSGSLCYNCHMPHTSYALLGALRSHRIDIPSVETSVRTGRPNACNLCHLDQTLQWSASHLSEWYAAPSVEFSREQRETAASLLWLLRGNGLQRAVAAWHLGWDPALEASGRHWQAPFLAQLTEDPYLAVRFVAERSLRQLPGFGDFRRDFDGMQDGRPKMRDEVLKLWESIRLPADNRHGPRLLMSPSGQLFDDAIDRLLEQRDDTALMLAE